MADKVTIALSKAIQAHGGEVKEISLRKPTGKEVMDYGLPTKIEITRAGTQIQHVNAEAIGNYVAALAAIPPSSVAQIEPCDWPELIAAVTNFFGKPETSSTGTSSSQGSTAISAES